MNSIHNFNCGGDSVVILDGVPDGEEERIAREITKGDPFAAQTGFLKNTAIKIPHVMMAGALFSADAALCCARFSGEEDKALLSSNAVDAPFSLHFDEAAGVSSLSLAAKAQMHTAGTYPSVVFGGCEYFIAEHFSGEATPALLAALGEESTQANIAFLVKNETQITPYFYRIEGDFTSFSAGSAAIALAFFESEASREFLHKTYRFPKGERDITMKRFLSETFDCVLTAQVSALG